MFLSYYYRKYLGYDNKTKLYSWEYKVVDSEFEEIGVGENMGAGVGVGLGVGVAVVNTYEKRKLNVAANLVRAFIWQNKGCGWTISNLIKWNKQFNPKFAKYEKDIEKYLVLI